MHACFEECAISVACYITVLCIVHLTLILFLFILSLVDGVWLEWLEWQECSTTCGGGQRFRERECEGPFYGGADCEGSDTDSQICGTDLCPSKIQEWLLVSELETSLKMIQNICFDIQGV